MYAFYDIRYCILPEWNIPPKKEEATTTPEVSTASSSPSVVYEKDILEEDVDDSEYIPYQRKNKAKKVVEQTTKGDYLLLILIHS